MKPYTDYELRRFDILTARASAPGVDHMYNRVTARLTLDAFVRKHGREKCEAMKNALIRAGRWG